MTNQIAGNAHEIPSIEVQDPIETLEIIHIFFNEQVLSVIFPIVGQLTKEQFLDLICDTLLPAIQAHSGSTEIPIHIQYRHTLFAPPHQATLIEEEEATPGTSLTHSC